MLAYFPIPYKDELLYSVIARFKIHQGITSDRQLVKMLFGLRDVAAVVDLPGHLQALEQHTYHLTHIDAKQWLFDHTLFPAYNHFIPASRREKIITSLYEGRAWDVHTRAGLAAFNLKNPTYLRICKSCYAEQLEQHGEVYWQRLFQLSGAVMCPIHQEFLYETNVPFRPRSKFEYISVKEAHTTNNLARFYNQYQTKLLSQISEGLSELLTLKESPIDSLGQWSTYYQQLGRDFGHLSSTCRIDHGANRRVVEQYWTPRLLKKLKLVTEGKMSWLVNIFRKHRKSFHYLDHLIVWFTFDKRKPADIISSAAGLTSAKTPSATQKTAANYTAVAEHRWSWLSMLKAHPNKGVAWLRRYGAGSAIYTWLYRNDRSWLRANTPIKVIAAIHKPVVDWQARDEKFLNRFQMLYQQGSLINPDGRTSKTWLIKQVEQRALLEKSQNKLPHTTDYIDSLVETVENYQYRRITQIILAMHRRQDVIKPWILYRKAGIRKEYQTDSMEKYINRLRMDLLYGNTPLLSENSR